jgi:hypothetical protein
MSEIDEIKKEVISKLRREHPNPTKSGGQSCGLPTNNVKLISDEVNIIIEVGTYRSQMMNYELARILMEIAIDETVK